MVYPPYLFHHLAIDDSCLDAVLVQNMAQVEGGSTTVAENHHGPLGLPRLAFHQLHQGFCVPQTDKMSAHVHRCDRLVGLVVKASASRAGGPGFESR